MQRKIVTTTQDCPARLVPTGDIQAETAGDVQEAAREVNEFLTDSKGESSAVLQRLCEELFVRFAVETECGASIKQVRCSFGCSCGQIAMCSCCPASAAAQVAGGLSSRGGIDKLVTGLLRRQPSARRTAKTRLRICNSIGRLRNHRHSQPRRSP